MGESSTNFFVCHWSDSVMTFLSSTGDTDLADPDDAKDMGTVLPFCSMSSPFTIFSMFFRSEAELLWFAGPFPFLLGACGVNADEDCCDDGRWFVDGVGDVDGEFEFAFMLCNGLLLRLLSGARSALAFDWPGVTASKAEPCREQGEKSK